MLESEIKTSNGYLETVKEEMEDLLVNGQVIQSLLVSAGFQPDKPFEGKLMSVSEIQYFCKKYDGLL